MVQKRTSKKPNGKTRPEVTSKYQVEMVPLADLKPHPRNYRQHPDDELAHIIESIKVNGFYRNIVIARENTILAGHGVRLAALKMGYKEAPAIRLDLDPSDPRALKILTGDNEIGHLGEIDDRALTEILKEIHDIDTDGLLGTGFDEMMLANLLFVTRPANEILDHNEAAEWIGMPDYDPGERPLKIMVEFRNEADRMDFAKRLGLTMTDKTRSIWWPPRDHEDVGSLRIEIRANA